METIGRFGTQEQKEKWLKPLLDGRIRSCFAMTEPAVASSDASNISIDIRKDHEKGEYVINGRKWYVKCCICYAVSFPLCLGECVYSKNLWCFQLPNNHSSTLCY